MRQSWVKKEMKGYTAEIKRLNRDNNLIHIIRAEHLYAIYRANKDRNYCSISDTLRDNRPKCMISSHLSIRHQSSMLMQLACTNCAPRSAPLPKIQPGRPVDSLWYPAPQRDPHATWVHKASSLLVHLNRGPEAVLGGKGDRRGKFRRVQDIQLCRKMMRITACPSAEPWAINGDWDPSRYSVYDWMDDLLGGRAGAQV